MTDQLIIKKCDELGNAYEFEISGYIPKILEGDFECMAERFASGECDDYEGELKDFCKFHRKENKLNINYKIRINEESMDDENAYRRYYNRKTTMLTVQVHKSIKKLFFKHL